MGKCNIVSRCGSTFLFLHDYNRCVGKNDPFVVLKMGNFDFKSHHLEGAGSACEWDYSTQPLTLDVSDALLR